MPDLISILMPFKNSEKFISECVESIIYQTERNWELIAVDDHSSDNSKRILEKLSLSDSRIRVYSNPRKGIIHALRFALENSKGNLIHRMDSDDLMPEQKLKTLKDELLKSGKGCLATGKVKYFSDAKISAGYLKYENWLNELCDKNSHWNSIYKECVIASPAWMLYREDLNKCGAFDNDIYPEDYDLVFRFYENNMKVVSSLEVIHLWREYSERTSRTNSNYDQEAFLNLKIHHLLKSEVKKKDRLLVLASGLKAKILIDILKNINQVFELISQDGNRSDSEISTDIIKVLEENKLSNNLKMIVAFENPKAQSKLLPLLKEYNWTQNKEYFLFS